MEAALIETRLREEEEEEEEEDESEIDDPRKGNPPRSPYQDPRFRERVAAAAAEARGGAPPPAIHPMFYKVLTHTDTVVNQVIIQARHRERLMAALTAGERQQMDRGSLRITAVTDVDGALYDMELKRNAAGTILLKSRWSDLVRRNLLCSGDRVVGVGFRMHPRGRLRLFLRIIRR